MASNDKDRATNSRSGAVDIDRLKAKVEHRLDFYFQQKTPDGGVKCAIRHSLLSPGKRIRPLITLLACRQSGAPEDIALDAACAVEMVHAASLIMDDLPSMDNARLRRGALATHVVFGEGSTMLATIALLNEAYRTILRCGDLDQSRQLRMLEHLTRAIGVDGLVGGQERDIAADGAKTGISFSEMQQCHMEKTGVLFAAAAAIGGEAAGASQETVDHLWSYGCNLGLAYQAFDDVVDIACSEEQAGKDVEQDLEKSTVVSFLGAEGATRSAERWLGRAVENARAASASNDAPLADLAQMVGAKFRALT